jgi:hypothetical protein
MVQRDEFNFLGSSQNLTGLRCGAARSSWQYLTKIIYISATNEAPSHRNSR